VKSSTRELEKTSATINANLTWLQTMLGSLGVLSRTGEQTHSFIV